ncbi:protein of unknown function [Methanoculleus bourgensis]|uniref:Uncharacterized protein n=1 Tax=Methanoculleus bourgensis TaxID=83986 RepID=A0A0X8XYT5_9EURY|nr:protein of unknown function [Methanoculleus bourgensis]
MEPCLFRHGKEDYLTHNYEWIIASMEPCLFRHGKGPARGGSGMRPAGFNGAMSFQTW